MKKQNNWVVKSQEVGQNPIVTFERTSLTKTLTPIFAVLYIGCVKFLYDYLGVTPEEVEKDMRDARESAKKYRTILD